MTQRRMTDLGIAARVVPTMLRWPPEIVFDPMRDCVEALRSMLRVLEARCDRVEHDSDLKPGSVARRRIQLGEEALAELAAFEPLQKAEGAVDENINNLESKMQNLLRKALDELREGVAATRRAVVERCQMRTVPQLNVRFRG